MRAWLAALLAGLGLAALLGASSAAAQHPPRPLVTCEGGGFPDPTCADGHWEVTLMFIDGASRDYVQDMLDLKRTLDYAIEVCDGDPNCVEDALADYAEAVADATDDLQAFIDAALWAYVESVKADCCDD